MRFPLNSFVAAPIALAIAITAMPLQANTKAGKVILSKGEVNATLAGNERALRRGKPIFEGDMVNTGSGAMLQMNMRDDGLISLSENSVFSVESYRDADGDSEDSVLLNMVEGGFRAVTGGIGQKNPAAVKVRTTVASIGIRGTGYEVFEYNGSLFVSILSGSVELSNKAGSLLIGENEEFNFARVDSDSSLPVGLYALPADVAANNPFFASIDVPYEAASYRVPLNQLVLNSYPVMSLTPINPAENPDSLIFTPLPTNNTDVTDGSSDPTTDGSTDTPVDEDIGGDNTALSAAEVYATSVAAHVLLPDRAQPYSLSARSNSAGDIVLLVDSDATEASYQRLIRPSSAGPAASYPKTMLFDSGTTWGVWLASATTPATQYRLNDGSLTTTSIEDTIYWLSTTPAIGLAGTYTFLSTGAYIGTSTEGDIDALSASMRVNFDSADVSNGFLIVDSGSYRWSTRFNGTLTTGANGDLGGDFSLSSDNNSSGVLSGYFVKSDEIFFTGAFSVSDINNATARGLLAMEGYQTLTVYGGDGTNLDQYGTLVAFEGSALLHGPTALAPLTTTELGYNSSDADGTLAGWFVELNNANPASGYPVQKTALSDNTYWGVWNADSSNTANLRYRTSENREYNSPIEAAVYWMSTDSMALTRTGSATFASTGDFVGSSNSGAVTSLTASFSFDFDSAAMTGGQLDLMAGGDAWTFDIANAASTELNMDNGYFSVRQTQVNAESNNGVFGAIEGYFVGSEATSISAAFGLFRQGDSNYLDSVNGLFSLQESR